MGKVTVSSVKIGLPKSATAVPLGAKAGGTVQRRYQGKTNLSATKKQPNIGMGKTTKVRDKIPPMSGPYINT